MVHDPSLRMVITSRERDIGGFSVRRILPYASHRMVGPFIFFDHMGPAEFQPGQGMDVRPHPHIGLATVTYLFDGVIRHRDSLGSNQLIEPGAVNWMTAGRGIVHSERTPEKFRQQGGQMNGIQCWIALPQEHEATEPFFSHHPKASLPEFERDGVSLKLLLGKAYGKTSPVPVHSELFYLEARMKKGQRLAVPAEGHEAAVYVVDGRVRSGSTLVETYSMAIAEPGTDLFIEALEDSRLMLLGGAPVGHRLIFWNLVSSSKDRIEEAKREWAKGPGPQSRLFPKVPGDSDEFIPLPQEPGIKGTIM